MNSAFKYLFGLVVAIYLLNSVGVPVYYHYCGGKLESVNALFEADTCCDNEEEGSDDCCNNETQIVAQFSETSFKDITYKIEPPVLYIPGNDLASFDAGKISNASFSIFPENDFPVPIPGREILISKSVLII